VRDTVAKGCRGKTVRLFKWLPMSYRVLSATLAAGTCIVLGGAIGIWGLRAAEASPLAKSRVEEAYRNLPLYFEANQGQSDGQVKFISRGSGYELFLTPTELVLHVSKASPGSVASIRKTQRVHSAREIVAARLAAVKSRQKQGTVLRIKAVGANPAPQVVGKEQLPGKVNYFLGSDPGKWRTNEPLAKPLIRWD